MKTEMMQRPDDFSCPPATALAAIAAHAHEQTGVVRIANNIDRAALAADALWRFAERTGLSQDGESVETVMIDFMADMFHLCRMTGLITSERNLFADIMVSAERHAEMDEACSDGE